jgi:hypothetical protein
VTASEEKPLEKTTIDYHDVEYIKWLKKLRGKMQIPNRILKVQMTNIKNVFRRLIRELCFSLSGIVRLKRLHSSILDNL